MKKILLFIFFTLLLNFPSHAQQLKLDLVGAVSKEVGPEHEYFNWGFSVGGDIFFFLNNNLLLGLRATYSRFTPDESEFTESVDALFSGEVSGDAFVVEIVPSLRLTTNYPMSNINIFAQAGAGLFILNNEIIVSGNGEGDVPVEEVFGEGTSGNFGFNVGGGLTFGNPQYISIDFYPLFNMVFLGEGDSFRYFSFNLSLGFGI